MRFVFKVKNYIETTFIHIHIAAAIIKVVKFRSIHLFTIISNLFFNRPVSFKYKRIKKLGNKCTDTVA